jgi:protein-arginine kinase activator protein McsA
MKFDDGQLPEYYDLFSLPITIDRNYYEKMLEKAIENENYELANEIMNKIKNDKWD